MTKAPDRAEAEMPPECVHCHARMECSYGNESWQAPFCANPECPNYCLLQTGMLPVISVSNEKDDSEY